MPQVHHMVLLEFKPEVGKTEIAEVLKKVEELRQSIPGINYCSSRPYSSPEDFNKSFTHGFLTTFESVEARDVYLIHPLHEIFKNTLFAMVDDAVAFDFVAG
jgi:Stress responsive A/B Barrel Domain